MKKQVKKLYFAITAGIVTAIFSVSLLAITITGTYKTTWQNQEVLTAGDLNTNFQSLQATLASINALAAATLNCTTGEIAKFDGANWACSTDDTGSGADNLGNHIATQNLDLGTNLLVGNGGTTGISIASNGNVGIGTISPGSKLEVNGDTSGNSESALHVKDSLGNSLLHVGNGGSVGIGTASIGRNFQVVDTTGGYIAYFEGTAAVAGDGVRIDMPNDLGGGWALHVRTAGTTRFLVESDGNVGIGTSSPSYKLHVNGTAAGTSWTNLSSRMFKESIEKVDESRHSDMLVELMELDLTTYKYKEEYGGNGTQKLGFIAEEMPKEVLSKDGKGVDVYELLAFTIGAMKAQQDRIEKLEVRLNEM